MKLPVAIVKGWPFAAAALVFILIVFQLTQTKGCGARDARSSGQSGPAWPMQRTPPPPPPSE